MSLTESLTRALQSLTEHDRVLLASDFDGVLAPFADDPSQVRPAPGAIDALTAVLSGGDAVAVVSGRHLTSLTHASGLPLDGPITLIGSHGAECSRPLELGVTMDDAAHSRLRRAGAALDEVVAAHPGARVERKTAGVVLHTRGLPSDRADAASAAALAVAEDLDGVHAMRGKNVIELSVLEISKGRALTALARDLGSDAVVYLGDDVTDETVFTALSEDPRHVTIKVGPGETAAAHRVGDEDDVVAVLRAIARWRADD